MIKIMPTIVVNMLANNCEELGIDVYFYFNWICLLNNIDTGMEIRTQNSPTRPGQCQFILVKYKLNIFWCSSDSRLPTGECC